MDDPEQFDERSFLSSTDEDISFLSELPSSEFQDNEPSASDQSDSEFEKSFDSDQSLIASKDDEDKSIDCLDGSEISSRPPSAASYASSSTTSSSSLEDDDDDLEFWRKAALATAEPVKSSESQSDFPKSTVFPVNKQSAMYKASGISVEDDFWRQQRKWKWAQLQSAKSEPAMNALHPVYGNGALKAQSAQDQMETKMSPDSRTPNQSIFRCSACSLRLASEAALEKHGANCPARRHIVCDLCGFTCLETRRIILTRHMAQRHFASRVFTCDLCARFSSSVEHYVWMHIRLYCPGRENKAMSQFMTEQRRARSSDYRKKTPIDGNKLKELSFGE